MMNLIKKWWFWPLFIGVIIRLVLMPITYHPDLLGHSSVAYFFAYEGQLNPYQHLLDLAPDHPLVKNIGVSDIFIYPPLAYFTLGLFRVLVKPLTDPNFVPYLWENLNQIYEMKGLMWHLFFFKFPYLFFDIGAAFLLSGLFDDLKKKRLAFILWLFNPLTLYATFMLGQLDLLPVFFLILSLYLIKKDKLEWAMISLGIGGSYKMFPLLLIIPTACFLTQDFKKRLRLMFLGALPFILVTLPYLLSDAYRQMVLFSPKSQKMLFMEWKMTSAEGIFPFVFLLSLIYYYSYYAKKVNVRGLYTGILLLIFSVTHFHPQWFLWVTPLLVLELVQTNFKHWIIVLTLFTSWLVITLFFEPSLSVGLFAPINPKLTDATGLADILGRYTDIFQLKSLIRSVFAGASLYYVFTFFKTTKSTNKK